MADARSYFYSSYRDISGCIHRKKKQENPYSTLYKLPGKIMVFLGSFSKKHRLWSFRNGSTQEKTRTLDKDFRITKGSKQCFLVATEPGFAFLVIFILGLTKVPFGEYFLFFQGSEANPSE